MTNTTDDRRNTLYGTLANAAKICGYCKKHKTGVTVTQLKRKQCLKKQCSALKRYPDHPFWEQHEQMKKLRLKRKQERWDS